MNQVVHRQKSQLPDASPGTWLQIPYLQEFFGRNWFMINDDMCNLYAIYDANFVETHFQAQLQPFNPVALDTDLQEHLSDRKTQISTHQGWVTQITDSYHKWVPCQSALEQNNPKYLMSLAQLEVNC